MIYIQVDVIMFTSAIFSSQNLLGAVARCVQKYAL